MSSDGSNNKNCILHLPKSDHHTDCKTSRHRALESVQGVLCARPAFSRTRLICSYFSQLQQRTRAKERREDELSTLLKGLTVSHTHSQAPYHSLADLRTGVPPTAELRACQAPGDHEALCSPTPCNEKGQFGQAWIQLTTWMLSEFVLWSVLLRI